MLNQKIDTGKYKKKRIKERITVFLFFLPLVFIFLFKGGVFYSIILLIFYLVYLLYSHKKNNKLISSVNFHKDYSRITFDYYGKTNLIKFNTSAFDARLKYDYNFHPNNKSNEILCVFMIEGRKYCFSLFMEDALPLYYWIVEVFDIKLTLFEIKEYDNLVLKYNKVFKTNFKQLKNKQKNIT